MEEQDRSSRQRGPAARRWRVVVGAALIAVLVPIGLAIPAGAAGNPALDHEILSSPISGWRTLAPSYLGNYATYINALEQAAVGRGGGTAVTAAEGWRSPASAKDFLLVTLVRITDVHLSTAQASQQLQQAAEAAAASFCTGATGAAARSVVSVVAIPHSYMVTCRAEPDGRVPSAITWSRSNVLAIVTSAQGAVGASQLDRIAVDQYGAMGAASGVGGGGGSGAGLGVGLAAGALIVGLSIVATVVRARRRAALDAARALADEGGLLPAAAVNPAGASLLQEISATPEAGWYADPLDASKRRFWTGTGWQPEGAAAPSDHEVSRREA